MFKLNHPYECKHCGKIYAILRAGIFKDSFLPVDVDNIKNIPQEDFFDSDIHKSHLLSCPGKQADWERVKKKLKLIDREREKKLNKELIKQAQTFEEWKKEFLSKVKLPWGDKRYIKDIENELNLENRQVKKEEQNDQSPQPGKQLF